MLRPQPFLLHGHRQLSPSLPTRFQTDRKSTRLNSSHRCISYAVFCLKKKKRTADADDDEGDSSRKRKVKTDEGDDKYLGSSPLSVIVPVGGRLCALL